MLTKSHFKDSIVIVLLVTLFILAVLIIKPIIFSVIYGVLLAYIFYPIYKIILKKLKNETISALLVCSGLLALIGLLAYLILNPLLKQAIKLYFTLQKLNLVELSKQILPQFLSSSELSETIINSSGTFLSNMLAQLVGKFENLILNISIILIQLFVVIFIFYFSLKDGKKAIDYLKSLSPLKKDIQDKFFKQFKDITSSVLLGQIVVGIVQGLIAGIGYFIFKIPNILILTILTMLTAIIPIIGPWLIWIPVVVYLFASGNTGAGIGLLIYGIFLVGGIDNILRPLIISRKTKINSAIIMIGMIGGLFTFGILGLIVGPLILAYVLLVMEVYRKKNLNENIIFIKK